MPISKKSFLKIHFLGIMNSKIKAASRLEDVLQPPVEGAALFLKVAEMGFSRCGALTVA